ncbi:hypothetical protein Ancab_024012 [Ancistrocladus abbreviatus]
MIPFFLLSCLSICLLLFSHAKSRAVSHIESCFDSLFLLFQNGGACTSLFSSSHSELSNAGVCEAAVAVFDGERGRCGVAVVEGDRGRCGAAAVEGDRGGCEGDRGGFGCDSARVEGDGSFVDSEGDGGFGEGNKDDVCGRGGVFNGVIFVLRYARHFDFGSIVIVPFDNTNNNNANEMEFEMNDRCCQSLRNDEGESGCAGRGSGDQLPPRPTHREVERDGTVLFLFKWVYSKQYNSLLSEVKGERNLLPLLLLLFFFLSK